jgi:ferritin-like metal-binding protein YciE
VGPRVRLNEEETTMDDQYRARDLFITGLKNAHAMESQALAIMRPQLKRIENYPEISRQLEKHIAETEVQIERLEGVLSGLGTDKSALKDAALSMAGTMAAMGHVPAADEILKNSFANYAFENYEIAAYKSLIALAQAAGQSQAVTELQKNLDEEQAMADWLSQNIETVTRKFASLTEAGAEAKK